MYNLKNKHKNKILNTIHQIWIGDKMPKHRKLYCSSVKKFSNYCNSKYILWTNDMLTKKNFPISFDLIKEIKKYNRAIPISDLIPFIKCHKSKLIKNIALLSKNIPEHILIPRMSKYAQIADIMRLEIINTHGGTYFDTNFEIKENKFKELKMEFQNKDFVCSQENPGVFTNSFFASKKNNKALTDMLKNIDNIDYLSGMANLESGPAFFGNYVKKHIPNPYIIPMRKIYPYVSWGFNATKDLTIHQERKKIQEL